MGAFEDFILSESKPTVGKEKLQQLAKVASGKYVSGDASLTDAVRELANSSDLNDEQTKRLVEMSNTATFLTLFENKYDKNIEFDLADPGAVLSTEKVKVASASNPYTRARAGGYVPGQEYISLESSFMVKTAAEEVEDWSTTDVKTYLADKDIIRDFVFTKTAQSTAFSRQLNDVRVEFTRTERGDEASALDCVYLMKAAGVELDLMKLIFDGYELTGDAGELTGTPNVDHPLFVKSAALVETFNELTNAAIPNLTSEKLREELEAYLTSALACVEVGI